MKHASQVVGFLVSRGRNVCASARTGATYALLLLALVHFAGGCADMITYSKDSYDEGKKLYNDREYAAAAGAFRNSTKQNPRYYQSFYMLGLCYDNMNQNQQAIYAFRQALDVQDATLEGKHDDVQRMRTINSLAAAIAKSDTRDAEINQVSAEARTGQNIDQYLLLARIYQLRGDPDSAVEAYDHALLLAPDRFFIAKEYGLYLEKLGQTTRAESVLRKAYAMNERDQEVTSALRRLGVVPGPSIKRESELVRPPLPKGPIPPIKFGSGGSTPPPPQSGTTGTVAAPRD